MKYKLYATIERFDGTLLRQWVCTLTQEQAHDRNEVRLRLQNYLKMLGHGYYLIDWYLEYR